MNDYIAGRFEQPKQADESFTIQSPADLNDTIASYQVARSQVDRAVDSATQAFRAWRKLAVSARAQLLRQYQGALKKNADALALSIAREIGKPLWEAKTEVSAMVGKIDLALGEGQRHVENRILEDLPGEIRHRPLGIVAVIGPFNFPGHLPNGQIVPALLAGNCVVFKPSEKGGQTAVLMARCFHEAQFPAGVFNLVQGTASGAAHLTSHAGIHGVLFTGSLDVGRKILAANAQRPGLLVALELGGKNASLVLEDCDLERTARELVFSGFATAGQRCTATARVIVTRPVAEALTARLKVLTEHISVGHCQADNVFMGPVINAHTIERLRSTLAMAEAKGASAVVPASEVTIEGRPGFYLRPSLYRLTEGVESIAGYTDVELFAPNLCIIVADDDEHAVTIANNTEFGLSAAVFTSSQQRFETLADALEVGVVHHNRSTAGASGRLPFGGIKSSGNHRAAGISMALSCSFPQGVLRPSPAAGALPTWPGMHT
jgi:succinylglutamic semialdehyde dehydrogenase